MKDTLKKFFSQSMVLSIALCVLGILLICFPQGMFDTFCIVAGIVLCLAGLSMAISYCVAKDTPTEQEKHRGGFATGMLSIMVGILLMTRSELIVKFLPVALGILIVGSGFKKLQSFIDLKKGNAAKSEWITVLVMGIIVSAIGMVLLFGSMGQFVITALYTLLGVGLLVGGLTDIVSQVMLNKGKK